jgi:hypothetical protein
MTVRLGYRRLAVTGSLLMTFGFIGLTFVDADSSRRAVLASGSVIGAGMGMSMLSLLLAVQHGVERSHLGLATSLQQFSRSVGAAVGVAAMGALLTRGLTGVAVPGGAEALAASGTLLTGVVRLQFAAALHQVFVAGAVLSGGALVATFFLPPVDFARGVSAAASERMLAAEITNLKPADEPVTVSE